MRGRVGDPVVRIASGNDDLELAVEIAAVGRVAPVQLHCPQDAFDRRRAGRCGAVGAQLESGLALEEDVERFADWYVVALGGAFDGVVGFQLEVHEIVCGGEARGMLIDIVTRVVDRLFCLIGKSRKLGILEECQCRVGGGLGSMASRHGVAHAVCERRDAKANQVGGL